MRLAITGVGVSITFWPLRPSPRVAPRSRSIWSLAGCLTLLITRWFGPSSTTKHPRVDNVLKRPEMASKPSPHNSLIWLGKYLSLALTLPASVVAGYILGAAADHYFHRPWL